MLGGQQRPGPPFVMWLKGIGLVVWSSRCVRLSKLMFPFVVCDVFLSWHLPFTFDVVPFLFSGSCCPPVLGVLLVLHLARFGFGSHGPYGDKLVL